MDTIENLIDITRSYHLRGWTPATSSNFSIRAVTSTPDVVHITRSGQNKGNLTPKGFIDIQSDGTPIESGVPSAETALHLMIYQQFPNIGAVLHTHSPTATVLSMAPTTTQLEFRNYEILKAFPDIDSHEAEIFIPIYDNDQDIPSLAETIKADLPKMSVPGFLIRGHGLYTWGTRLRDADRHLEALEFLLNCDILRRQIS